MVKKKIVLATLGTLGDLHPFIAIGLGLREQGFDPVIATFSHFRDNVEAAGLRFHALRPSQEQIESDAGMSQYQILRAVQRAPQVLWTQFILPYLRQTYEDSLAVAQDAALVFTSSIAIGSKLAAEKLGVPHIGVVLQPSLLLSAYDPPLIGNVQALSRLIYCCGTGATRAYLGLAKAVAGVWARPVQRFRREIGLPRSGLHPFFEGQLTGGTPIGLYSRVLGAVQPDFPDGFVIAGFAFYDGPSSADATTSDLDAFIDGGRRPLVFTQGTSAVHDSAHFTAASIEAVRALGERAIFVLDEAQRAALQDRNSRDLLIAGYVPYSTVFSRCKAIIHHAGIGTSAQALRSGRPQLICPYFADQPDNAARLARLGVARVVDPRSWTALRVAQELRLIGNDAAMSARAISVSQQLTQETAVDTVSRIVAETLAKTKALDRSRH
jgi:rhamnosyltransferase subunit B